MYSIYFDNAATTHLDPAVRTAMRDAEQKYFGNPSSIHRCGQKSKVALENARSSIAETIGAKRNEIVFTSGGTESDNMALISTALANRERGRHIITTQIEHPAILNTCRFLEKIGFSVSYVDVHPNGLVDIENLVKSINSETILVSVMLANNETGCIIPIHEISSALKGKNIYLHTDAVQAFGKMEIDVDELGVDMMSLSAHKIYGPKGVGLLYIRHGTRIDSYMRGGSQEYGRRGGTENVIGVIGFAEAVAQLSVKKTERERIGILRDFLEEELKSKIQGIKINGANVARLISHSNVYFPFISADSLLIKLDMLGIAVSTGSACSSGSVAPSHVLKAMNLPENQVSNSVRFSIGRFNTKEEINEVVASILKISQRIDMNKAN